MDTCNCVISMLEYNPDQSRKLALGAISVTLYRVELYNPYSKLNVALMIFSEYLISPFITQIVVFC